MRWIHRTSIGAALAITLAASESQAQQGGDVEAEHMRGMQAREAHRDHEAFDIFRAIYERTHEPRALARMALAEAALARWVDAELHLMEALEQSGDTWINQNRTGLETQLATIRSHLANLEVSSNVPGAQWSLDGTEMPPLPLSRPVRVPEGPHVIDVRATGHDPVRHPVNVPAAPRGLTRESVTLVRSVAVAATPPVPLTPRAGVRVMTPTTPSAEGSGWHVAGVTSLVVGGAAVGVGVLGLVLRNSRVDDFTQEGCWLQDGAPTGAPTCSDVYDAGSTMQALSVAGFVVGGVGLAAGTVMMLVAPGASSRETARWGCGQGPGTVGVACSGRF